MVKEIIDAPTGWMYKLLLWFNKGAQKILIETEERVVFEQEAYKEANVEENCYFLGKIPDDLLERKVNETFQEFLVYQTNGRD